VPASATVRGHRHQRRHRHRGAPGRGERLQRAGRRDDCPCEVEAFIFRDGDDAAGPSSWTQLPAEAATSGRVNTSLPVHWAVQIPAGSTETFRVAVFVNGAEPEGVQAEASLSSLTAPFGDVPTG
jgi:hypothetical protein